MEAEVVEEVVDPAVAVTLHDDVVPPLTLQFVAASPVLGPGPDPAHTTKLLLVLTDCRPLHQAKTKLKLRKDEWCKITTVYIGFIAF